MGFTPDFDTEDSQYQGDFNRSTIPEGRYQVCLIECFEKSTKNQNGACLHMKFQVIEGPFSGAHIMAFPIIEHRTDAQLVVRGRKQITQIARACKVPKLTDTDQLYRIPLIVDVSIDGDFNRIDGYFTIEEYGAKSASVDSIPVKPISKEIPF